MEKNQQGRRNHGRLPSVDAKGVWVGLFRKLLLQEQVPHHCLTMPVLTALSLLCSFFILYSCVFILLVFAGFCWIDCFVVSFLFAAEWTTWSCQNTKLPKVLLLDLVWNWCYPPPVLESLLRCSRTIHFHANVALSCQRGPAPIVSNSPTPNFRKWSAFSRQNRCATVAYIDCIHFIGIRVDNFLTDQWCEPNEKNRIL